MIFIRAKILNLPDRKKLNINDKFKRNLIKLFFVTTKSRVLNYIIFNLLFIDEKKLIFLDGYLYDMYTYHSLQDHVMILPVRDVNTIRFDYNHSLYNSLIDFQFGEVVFINIFNYSFIKLYKKLHPNKIIKIRYVDDICHNKNCQLLPCKEVCYFIHQCKQEKLVAGIESYSLYDAQNLDIKFNLNKVNNYKLQSIKKSYSRYLLTFIGAYRDSVDYLDKLTDKLISLYGRNIKNYINIKIMHNANVIPYDKFLEEESQSEIIVDLYRLHPEEGLSFRISEAVALHKKIITNRTNVLKLPIYSKQQFFILGVDDIHNLKKFIENDIHIDKNIIDYVIYNHKYM